MMVQKSTQTRVNPYSFSYKNNVSLKKIYGVAISLNFLILLLFVYFFAPTTLFIPFSYL